MGQNYDLIVIGGGIIGNSIAAHLAKEDLSILVINSNNLGTPASIAAAGLLTPFQIGEIENPLLKEFCFKAFEYFPKFYEKIKSDSGLSDIDLGYKQIGTLYLIFSISESAKKENEIKSLKNTSAKISFLIKQEVSKLIPLITKEIIGAYHYPQESLINNPKFLKALNSNNINNKVRFLNTEAIEINYSKNKIENIVLANKDIISAKNYVLCNGVWANNFLKKLFNINENIIKAIKGEILQVEAIHELPLQKIIFCDEGYILPREATNQYERNSILIGSTRDEVNPENKDAFQNTMNGLLHLTSLFQKLIPTYKNYHILNMWSGLRPKTKDSMPIIGKTEFENLYCCLGHYRNGILMGPISGKIISDLILRNNTEYNIEPFKIDRLLTKQSARV